MQDRLPKTAGEGMKEPTCIGIVSYIIKQCLINFNYRITKTLASQSINLFNR